MGDSCGRGEFQENENNGDRPGLNKQDRHGVLPKGQAALYCQSKRRFVARPHTPRLTNTYFDMSQGDGSMPSDAVRGSWNQGEQWNFICAREQQIAVDGGSGMASIKLQPAALQALEQLTARGASDPAVDPVTGAELGMADLSALSNPEKEAKAKLKKNAQKGSV
jgi:hypothetical protein